MGGCAIRYKFHTLGIKLNVSDFPVFGSLTLYGMAAFMCFSMRRENQEIGWFLVEAHGTEYDTLDRQMVYQGIVSHMVLRTVEQDRDVYDSLSGQIPPESLTKRERRRIRK